MKKFVKGTCVMASFCALAIALGIFVTGAPAQARQEIPVPRARLAALSGDVTSPDVEEPPVNLTVVGKF